MIKHENFERRKYIKLLLKGKTTFKYLKYLKDDSILNMDLAFLFTIQNP